MITENSFTPRRRAKDLLFVHSFKSKNTDIVSNKRVKGNGEVYSPYNVIYFMVNNVRQRHIETNNPKYKDREFMETSFKDMNKVLEPQDFMNYIDSYIFEPSCGSGNFLEMIYTTKVKDMFRLHRQLQCLYALQNDNVLTLALFKILSTIHAIDILADNVVISRNRLFHITNRIYKRVHKRFMPYSLAKLFAYLLRINIQQANTLISLGYNFTKMKITPNGHILYYFEPNPSKSWYDKMGWHWCYQAVANDIENQVKKNKMNEKQLDKYISEHYNTSGEEYEPLELPLMFDYNNPPKDDEIQPFMVHITKVKDVYEHHRDFTENHLPKQKRKIVLDTLKIDSNLSRTIVR